jgi:transcriptional regulator with XRE-family HTH domain
MTDDQARDEFPELATNSEWRAAMRKARVEAGLSQEDLAERAVAASPQLIRGTQGVISKLESGGIGRSRLVVPICRLLGIQLPSHYASDRDREWLDAAHTIEARSPAQAAALLAAVKAAAAALAEPDPDDE